MALSIIEEITKSLGITDVDNIIREDDIYSGILQLDCLIEPEVHEIRSDILQENNCRKVYKYYQEETTIAVQTHFNESLKRVNNMMNTKATQIDLPEIKPVRNRRRTTKQVNSVITPLSTTPTSKITTGYNHCYGRPSLYHPAPPSSLQPSPHTTYLVPSRFEIMKNLSCAPPYIRHGVPHQVRAYHNYNHPKPLCLPRHVMKMEHGTPNRCNLDSGRKPAAYKAFYDGKTLIEIYSPCVGNGFNPRYNTHLIEPIINCCLPHITGQSTIMPPPAADIQAFLHIALDFNPPPVTNAPDLSRLYGSN